MGLFLDNSWSELLRLAFAREFVGAGSAGQVSVKYEQSSTEAFCRICHPRPEDTSMGINIRRFRNRWWRRFASIPNWLSQLGASLGPEDRESGTQRMCPSCGLITPRHKACCLECGKSLKPA